MTPPEVTDEVRTAVFAALDVLKTGGAEMSDVEVPYAEQAKNANHVTLVAEAYSFSPEQHGEPGGTTTVATPARGAGTWARSSPPPDYTQAAAVSGRSSDASSAQLFASYERV